MSEQHPHKRGGSLVFPILLIVLGVLFLLDNLNITNGIDWDTIVKLWPILLVALGLEIILGRRVSFGAIFLIVILVLIAGAVAWWSVVGTGERTTQSFTWELDGVERAEMELNTGIAELNLRGAGDMGGLLVADMDLAHGVRVREDVSTDGDVARGHISTEGRFWGIPGLFGGRASQWDLQLNERVRWELDVNAGVGEVDLDLSELLVSELKLDAGVGEVRVTMPRRGGVEASVKGGVGDIRITIPEGVQARFQVDRGIGDLTVGGRFTRRGDYYETEDLSRAESFIELDIDIGVGSVTVH
jgi:hypothetical protein